MADCRIALTSQRHNHWLLILLKFADVKIIPIFQVDYLLDNGLFAYGKLPILGILLFVVNILV